MFLVWRITHNVHRKKVSQNGEVDDAQQPGLNRFQLMFVPTQIE